MTQPIPPIRVGFTGTRAGLTPPQLTALRQILSAMGPGEFHHGCSVGADDQAHSLAAECGWIRGLHPPTSHTFLATITRLPGDLLYPPGDYLTRNQDIVDSTESLIACVKGPEELRSGTWATIRYARKKRKPVTIIYPDGSVKEPK